MENFASEKHFEYNEIDALRLVYCGLRERCYGHHYNEHNLDNFILTLINEGSAEFKINGEKVVLSENCLYVMHSKSKMSYITESGKPWSISWLVTEGPQIECILNELGITRENPYLYLHNPQKIKSILNEIFEKINRADITSKMECKSLLYSFFAALSEEKSLLSSNAHIDSALKYIHKHYCENITVQKLSNEICLNFNYFSKLFKQHIGIGPTAYINALKLKKAKFLLKHTNTKVSEISKAVGYDDPFYFSRIFKKTEKISPQQYRYSGEIEFNEQDINPD